MTGTKKIKQAGRFGVRYGERLRQKIIDIEKKQRAKHKCPYCKSNAVKRISAGIWRCKKCKSKFAGKAYEA